MTIPAAWSVRAYDVMVEYLRKRFGDSDRAHDVAVDRLLEVWATRLAVSTAEDFVRLCLNFVRHRFVCYRNRDRRFSVLTAAHERELRTEFDAQTDVLNAVRILPLEKRRIVEMHYLDGLSDPKIAVRLYRDATRRQWVGRQRRAALEEMRTILRGRG